MPTDDVCPASVPPPGVNQDRDPRNPETSEVGSLPDNKEGSHEGPGTPAATSYFVVYAITYDAECFGLEATREEAEASLARQIAEGGPAWEDCNVNTWQIKGVPEVHHGE